MQLTQLAYTFSKETTLLTFYSTKLKFTYSEKKSRRPQNLQKSPNPKISAPIVFFVNFVAFSEYVNFSFVLQKFHRLVSFENVDAIRVNLVINSKGHRVVSFENGDAIRVKLVINSKGCHLC